VKITIELNHSWSSWSWSVFPGSSHCLDLPCIF